MPHPKGGRADKNGNRYEIKWVIYNILDVASEKISSVTLEALGVEEDGVDLVIEHLNGKKEYQQCKSRNGSKENWTIGALNQNKLLEKWIKILNTYNDCEVSLVSPLAFTYLEDMVDRAKNCGNNYEDFYQDLIGLSNKNFKTQYEDYCHKLGLNTKKINDIAKSVEYLRRTKYIASQETMLKQMIMEKIEFLFIGNPNTIYKNFIALIIDGDIFGEKIDSRYMYKYLKKQKIYSRNLNNDARILPRISELNEEYKNTFLPIKNQILHRDETQSCISSIYNGNSIILHGRAGNGKSGVTQEIINYLEQESIFYIAIKLDKRTPKKNIKQWSEDLGLTASLVHCIHSFSKSKRAIIILDQLDALRWTQAHSSDSLLVCEEIINQVNLINLERKEKISIVFVSRTYDLENDRNIKNLFNSKTEHDIIWDKIHVDILSYDVAKNVIGNKYEQFSLKLKSVLRIPSNLYVWEKLDEKLSYDDCFTSNHLISKWWIQILKKCHDYQIDEGSVRNAKDQIVNKLNELGRISIVKTALDIDEVALEYLASNGLIYDDNNTLSFSHQSLLDFFLSEKMVKEYYNDVSLINIIGDKEKQSPGKRYQTQMFMQSILDSNVSDFVTIGRQLLNSTQIRFYMKYIFLELLSQVEKIDQNIKEYILDGLKDPVYSNHIINNVIIGNLKYIDLLNKEGILEKWMNNDKTKNIVFRLLASITPYYNEELIGFIRKHSFKNNDDDESLFSCFSRDINEDKDEMFELRMEYYIKYPIFSEEYLNFKEMMNTCQLRTIRMLDLWLTNKTKKETVYQYAVELLDETDKIFITDAKEVINILLPHIPLEKENIKYSNWAARKNNKGLERTCILILKKANHALIQNDANEFLKIYHKYFGKGYLVLNELILDGLNFMSNEFSDSIIEYLSFDIDLKYFEESSNENNELELAKKVLQKHSKFCSKEKFSVLEKQVVSYISPKAVIWYKRRIKFNKNKENNIKVYWSFWGDLQYEILSILPNERLTNISRQLLKTLNRKFEGKDSVYANSSYGHCGSVWSPIDNKNLSDKNWLKILSNKSISNRSLSKSKAVKGGFISNSIDEFSSSFAAQVSSNPVRMIKLALMSKETIRNEFVESLFNGVAYSNKLSEIPVILIEEMFEVFGYDLNSYRSSNICRIIEKHENTNWSNQTLEMLKDIAINHHNPSNDHPNVTNKDDNEMKSFEMLQTNAINCIRGNAAEAIGALLWNNKKLFHKFKDTIEILISDNNSAVQYAALFSLWPVYNFEKEWASQKILYLYEKDIRFIGFEGSRRMFYLLYNDYKDRIIEIIKTGFHHNDKYIVEVASYSMTEMYINESLFQEEFESVSTFSEIQINAITYMTSNYFNKAHTNRKCKEIFLKFKNCNHDIENSISRLFFRNLIELKRDEEFLKEIMNSNMNRKLTHTFISYLEEQSLSIVQFASIIFTLCDAILKDNEIIKEYWVSDDLSKLIIALYDETAEGIDSKSKEISQKCLNLWDLMFEKQIGVARKLSQQMLLK